MLDDKCLLRPLTQVPLIDPILPDFADLEDLLTRITHLDKGLKFLTSPLVKCLLLYAPLGLHQLTRHHMSVHLIATFLLILQLLLQEAADLTRLLSSH